MRFHLKAVFMVTMFIKEDEFLQCLLSHEAKKKHYVCPSSGLRNHYSELFTWMAALNFKIL